MVDGDDSISSIELGPFDITCIVLYFLFLFLVAIYTTKDQAKRQGNHASTESYFLAERSVSYWAVAASLFASNIGSEHFVGLAGSAAQNGFPVGFFEIGAIPAVLLLGFFFLPVYMNALVSTTPDWLEKRYSWPCKTIVVAVSLAIYIFTKIAATLYASQLLLVELIHINKWVAVVLLVILTTTYTILGGLEAVVYTEALQTCILLVGGIVVSVYAVQSVDGMENLKGELPDQFFHIFQPATHDTYPWTGFVFGFYTFAPWYWGIDQVMVQRTLAAKNIAHGQLGCIYASVMKFLPFFLMIIPGMCARVLMDKKQLEDPDYVPDYNSAYPFLILHTVPVNARGLIIAAMLAALMSALASVFNSAATLFTLNIWKPVHPNASEKRLVLVGRVTVGVLALLALGWLPVIPLLGDQFFVVIQKPPSYFAPPILCVFFWGMVSKYPKKSAGMWTLTTGFIFGMFRFVFETVEAVYGEGNMFGSFTSINYMHFAAISFWMSTMLLMGISYGLSRVSSPGAIDGVGDGFDDDVTVDDVLLFSPQLFDQLMERYYKDLQRQREADEDSETTIPAEVELGQPQQQQRIETTNSSTGFMETYDELAIDDDVNNNSRNITAPVLQEETCEVEPEEEKIVVSKFCCFSKTYIQVSAGIVLVAWLINLIIFG